MMSNRGGGYEYNVALLAMCVALVLFGGGKCALDAWYAGRRRGRGTHTAAGRPQVPAAV
jgi:hypothetical protein